jgi:hypothetical protein
MVMLEQLDGYYQGYNNRWQEARIEFILSKYDESFFSGKRILELAPFNGRIGGHFSSLGAEVEFIEGRESHVEYLKLKYPRLRSTHATLDTPDWQWGQWDIIINFGLFYHLEHNHKQHLKNCIDNCNLMFFESVIFDSDEPSLYFRKEQGADQSLTDRAGTPSTSYVENIFKEKNVKYTKYSDSSLNGEIHRYDWPDSNTRQYADYTRRFWIVEN